MIKIEYTAEAKQDLNGEYELYKLLNPLQIDCNICFTPEHIVIIVYQLEHVQLCIDTLKTSNTVEYSYTHYYMSEEDIPEQWFIRCIRKQ